MGNYRTWAARPKGGVTSQFLDFLRDDIVASYHVDEDPETSRLASPQLRKSVKEKHDGQKWQDAVHLLRLQLNMRDVNVDQQSLALRPVSTKRRASRSLAERANKSVRTGESASFKPHVLSTEEFKPESQALATLSRHPISLKFSTESAEGNIELITTLSVSTQSGTRLCEMCIEPLSSEDQNILKHAVQLHKPDASCPCRIFSSFAAEDSKAGKHVVLHLDLYWQNVAKFPRSHSICSQQYQAAVLFYASLLTPQEQKSNNSQWTPRLFYNSVYSPPHDSQSFGGIEVPGLRTGLYSFQSRTLRWLLKRETPALVVDDTTDLLAKRSTDGFVRLQDANGRSCFFNGWLQTCTTDDKLPASAIDELQGGILAEEMGLGKTVEILSLIQSHKRPVQDFAVREKVRCSPATLIIAPKAIIEQWKEEISTHCPSLAVMMYDGIKAHGSKKGFSDDEMVQVLSAHDIILVTYDVLSREVWFATDPPDRNMRFTRVTERRKSPLVQIDWWRIVLDEAQMIERGVTYAAKVANQLPRQNAWAVTGTPIKKDSHDLLGLLTFLRLTPYCRSNALWSSLVTSYQPIFRELIQKICLRHSKDQVKAELQLPTQKRVVITVPFTAIEEQNYVQLFEQMTTECGLDIEGKPEPDLNDPHNLKVIGLMRSWLSRLRQICLHPEVGEKNRRALGRSDRAPLRTVGDVLQVMCEQNELSLRVEERVRLQSMLRRGQLLENAKFPDQAMEIWRKVEYEAQMNVDIDRRALADAEREGTTAEAILRDTDVQGEEQGDNQVSRLKNRLRTSLEVKHIATFFIANALFQIKTDPDRTRPDSEEFNNLEKQETSKYEEAKQIRRELLAGVATRASSLMASLSSKVGMEEFVKIPPFLELLVDGGIETRKYVDRLEHVTQVLEQQKELILEWREALVKAILSPLVDQEEDELTGEEYEQSTRAEDQIHAWIEAMRLITADRSQVLTGQKNTNVRREASNILRNAIAGEGHAPELMKRLLRNCNEIRLGETQDGDIEISLRGLIAQIQHHQGSVDFNGSTSKRAEKAMLERILQHVKPEATKQQKAITALEKELDMFSDVVNSRVDYYRQLQEISDLVAPFEEELDAHELESRLRQMQETEAQSQKRVDKLRARAKYLDHLRDDSSTENVERKCIICQDVFDTGCLTTCGHVYCKECILLWWRQHRSCPTCKASLAKTDLQPITYKPLAASAYEHGSKVTSNATTGPCALPEAAYIYSEIGAQLLDDIKAIDLRGSYGTKIDMLARHLLWIRQHDPGAKAVVFSQFRDFLEVLEHSFTRFGIGWSSIEDGAKGVERFKRDAGIECLLLHAKAQASGLNLVNATHVFICEPLINTAIELQVIARVHRIGQHSSTTVWMYLVNDTVEEAIYEISVGRRISHINSGQFRKPVRLTPGAEVSNPKIGDHGRKKKPLDEEIDAANSIEMEEAPTKTLLTSGRGGGEQVAKEDLWQCLFKYKPNLQGSIVSDEVDRVTAAFLASETAESRREIDIDRIT